MCTQRSKYSNVRHITQISTANWNRIHIIDKARLGNLNINRHNYFKEYQWSTYNKKYEENKREIIYNIPKKYELMKK